MSDGEKSSGLERPSIILSNRQLDAVLDEAIDRLAASNAPQPWLFVLAKRVVSVGRDERERPSVCSLDGDGMTERLAAVCDWLHKSKSRATGKAKPPKKGKSA